MVLYLVCAAKEAAALVRYPGQAPNTTQKIVLAALGGCVAAAPENYR